MRITWNHRVVMFSAWKAKMNTSVASSAITVTGWKNATNFSLNHSTPLARISHARESIPAARGITTKTSTEYSSTLNGTSRSVAPDTRSLTTGANATSMMRSLTETCTRVYAGSPSERYDHTNTIAVHGAAARMMTPAMYWLASSCPMSGRKRWRKNSQPKNAIENGLTSQLTTIVMNSPFGFLPTRAIDAKSILSIIG